MVGICSEIRFLAAVGFAVVSVVLGVLVGDVAGVVGIATRPAVCGGGSRGVVADVYITRRVRVSWHSLRSSLRRGKGGKLLRRYDDLVFGVGDLVF